MIDGFRHGFIDPADGAPAAGARLAAGLDVALGAACDPIVRRGWSPTS